MFENFKNKINRYGALNGYDILKNIAFFTMVIDHMGYFLFPTVGILRIIGRMSAPIFFFLFGYSYKKNQARDRQLLLLGFITALIEIAVDINNIIPVFNILFSLYISGKCIEICNTYYKKHFALFLLTILFVFMPVNFILKYVFDYGIFAVLMVFVGYLFRWSSRNQNFITATVFITLSFCLNQINTFYRVVDKVNIIVSIVLYLVYMIYLYCYFHNAKTNLIKQYNIKIKSFEILLLFISRYSLILYPIHIILILLVKILWQL